MWQRIARVAMSARWRARSGGLRAFVRAQVVARGQGEARLVRLERKEQQGAPAIAPAADGTSRGWLLALAHGGVLMADR